MNRAYRLIWNEARNMAVVVSEKRPGRGRRAACRAAAGALAALLLGVLPGEQARADNCTHSNNGNGVRCGYDAKTPGGTAAVAIGSSTRANAFASYALGSVATASGDRSYAIGYSAKTTGNDSYAIGYSAEASGAYSYAMGYRANASGLSAYALGEEAKASGEYAYALGAGAEASGKNSIALGTFSVATVENTISVGNAATKRRIVNVAAGTGDYDAVNVAQLNAAISTVSGGTGVCTEDSNGNISCGSAAKATGGQAVAIGNSTALAYGATAVGSENTAEATASTAVGFRNNTADSAYFSTAVGYSNTANASYSTALGNINSADAEYSTAVGNWNTARGEASSAMGYGNTAESSLSTAVGYNNTAKANGSSAMGVSNTAEGAYSTTLGYLNTAEGVYASAVGVSNTAQAGNSTAVGYYNTAESDNATAMGYLNTSKGFGSTAVGYWNTAGGLYSTVIGAEAKASGHYSISMGRESEALGNFSNAIGSYAIASGTSSTAVGSQAEASGNYANAIGIDATASGISSTALGDSATATLADAVALGSHSAANTAAGGVGAYAPGGATEPQWKSTLAAVAVGDAANGKTRQITGVAAGSAATDAVNVAQLDAAIGSVSGGGTPYTAGDGISIGAGNVVGVNADAATLEFDANTKVLKVKTGGAVASGDTGIVTGGTVHSATKDIAEAAFTGTNLQIRKGDGTVQDLDLSGLSGTNTVYKADGKTIKLDGTTFSAITDGKVAANNEGIVTGGTMYDELRPADGIYVKTANTTAANLKDLDTQVKTNADDIAKGLNFSGDAGGAVNRQLGDTLAIVGDGNNLSTVVDASGIVPAIRVQMSDASTFNTVTANAVNAGAVHVGAVNIDGNYITGLANTAPVTRSNYVSGRAATEDQLAAHHFNISDGRNTSGVYGGDTVRLSGDRNIHVSVDGLDIHITLDPDLNVRSVTTGRSRMDDSGFRIAGGPSMTVDGIDAAGTRVRNVADGIDPGDAVNRGQLDALDYRLSNRIGRVEDKAYAGVASAMAMSALPRSSAPGDLSLGAGVSAYEGENALAVGGAYTTPGGLMLTLAGTVNNEEASAAAGLGFRFNLGR